MRALWLPRFTACTINRVAHQIATIDRGAGAPGFALHHVALVHRTWITVIARTQFAGLTNAEATAGDQGKQ